MQILVTGIAGFIGSNLGEKLLVLGNQVVGIDNFDPFYSKEAKLDNLKVLSQHPDFVFYNSDIRDAEALSTIFSKHSFELVIHLAAKAGVRPSIDNVKDYYDVNVTGTLNLMETMKANNVTKLIFSSSSSIYGNNTTVPFSENDIVDFPISPYASTKKSGELLCHVYAHLFGFNVTCLRFFTVYGPRQRPDLAIHKFVSLITQNKPIPFYGDGTTSRDYTYIDDIVQGVICAMNNLKGFNIYNLGESKVIQLKELIGTIEHVLNKKAILEQLPFQPGDVNKTYANISKARNELGYDPKFDLLTGISRFVEWYNCSSKQGVLK